jgi:hypothetical protein
VSISVIPRSIAAWMVSMASCSPEPPHIQPPIAQVPRPIRDGFSPVPAISIVSMAHLPVDSA